MFQILRISFFLIAIGLSNASFANDAHPSSADPHEASASKKVSAYDSGDPFVGPATEAKKLYKRYKRASEKTIIAIACVRSPSCIEPEDEVLRYSKDALRILQKLDVLAA